MNISSTSRLAPLDWMRGLVMVFMTLDHVSAVFNRERLSEDSYSMFADGAPLFIEPGNPLHFFMRWITHLCAPTFIFLAGAALALSVANRTQRGDSAFAIDRHLLVRGSLLIVLEIWMSISSMFPVLQVLYSIGASLLFMIVLRRLPSAVLLALAFMWMGAGEWITESMGLQPMRTEDEIVPLFGALFFVNGLASPGFMIPALPFGAETPVFFALYPCLPWLAIMMVGWVFGRWLKDQPKGVDGSRRIARVLTIGGVIALAVFMAQRIFDGYGNFWMPRGDDTLLRWLQVSKYPPSLAFYGLELGLMALTLAAFFRFQSVRIKTNGPLLVFGQVALFFFLIHVHIMMLVRFFAYGFEDEPPLDATQTLIGTAIALIVLYPLCRLYRSLKQARPKGLLQYF